MTSGHWTMQGRQLNLRHKAKDYGRGESRKVVSSPWFGASLLLPIGNLKPKEDFPSIPCPGGLGS